MSDDDQFADDQDMDDVSADETPSGEKSGGVRQIVVEMGDDGQRLDRWLKKYAPDLPYALVQKLMRKGQIRVDGGRVKTDTRLNAGQTVRLPPAGSGAAVGKTDTWFRPHPGDADLIRSMVIYDDGEVIALNKPAGIAVQGGMKIARHIDGLLEHLADRDGVKPKLCHRLDRDTSGVLLLARDRETAKRLGRAFEGRNIRKYYWALTAPAPQMNDGVIDAPLIKGDGPYKDMMIVDAENGKFSRTEFQVIERAGPAAAFVMFWPRTGRTHQIRVHAAEGGFPLIGDEKYGHADPEKDDARINMIHDMNLAPRLHLHAWRIVVPHPTRKGMIDVTAPLADDLRKSWKAFDFRPQIDHDPFANIEF